MEQRFPQPARRLAGVLLVGLLFAVHPAAGAEEEVGGDAIPVVGVDGVLEQNLRAIVGLLDATAEELSSPWTLERLIERAPDEALEALSPFGFDDPEIRVVRAEDGSVERLEVDPGPPTRITGLEIEFEGPPLDPGLEEDLRSLVGLEVGDRLDHQAYEDAKRAVQSGLHDAGRLRADAIEHRILLDRERHRAEITLRWDAGPRHFFGPVSFSGAQFPDALMQRFVPYEVGDPFSRRELDRMIESLLSSPWFRSAEVLPRLDRAGEDHRVPIEVEIEPMPRNLFEIGLSAGTDSGAGVEGIFERRWLDRRGRSFRARLSPRTRRTVAEAVLSVPHRERLDRQWSLGLRGLDETTDTNEKESLSLRIGRQRLWGDWRRSIDVRALRENFVVGGESGSATLFLLEGSLSRKSPEREPIPRFGWSLDLAGRVAAEELASDTSLAQFEITGRQIATLTPDWRVLGTLRLGATWVEDFELLPASLRFYAGGDRSLRGFDYESLGPLNDRGLVTGGRHLAVASLELERRLTDLVRLAVFADHGNALNDLDDPRETGVGLGARLVTPVGMVRVDLGWPISEDDPSLRLHFTVGADL